MHVYTRDKAALRQSVMHPGERKSVWELVQALGRLKPQSVDGGFVAAALGHGITTEADTLTDLREMVKDAVQCHFHDAEQMPKIIRFHFVRDEVLSL
jgi:hypothetical protein